MPRAKKQRKSAQQGPLIPTQLSELLAVAGIRARQQATFVAGKIGVTPVTARRKLAGKIELTEQEIRMVLAAIGYEYHGLAGGAVKVSSPRLLTTGQRHVDTVWEVNGHELPCVVTVSLPERRLPPAAIAEGLARMPDGTYRIMGSLEAKKRKLPLLMIDHIEARIVYAGSGPTVAVVEESEQVRNGMCEALSTTGFNAVGVAGATEFKKRLPRADFEGAVFVWDSKSRKSCRDAVKAFREVKKYAPVVLICDSGDSSDDQELNDLADTFNVALLSAPASQISVSRALLPALESRLSPR